MSTYIERCDLTDNVINNFEEDILLQKLEMSDDAVEDLAEIRGVETTEIKTDPVHFKVKRYAQYWVYSEICLDYIGTNNVDIVEQEKYYRKWEIYNQKVKELALEITPQMLRGTVYNQRDRAGVSTGILYRG